jgi:acyl phosphate:glycerol-3-phosphate acyltransferase
MFGFTDIDVLAMLAGYLFGSIPFGLILTRMAGLGDIRTIGSGNIGATNVLRTGNKSLAFSTLILDGAKGAIAVLVATNLTTDHDSIALAGLAALLGHIFPVWLKFNGGKGVATSMGVVLAIHWPAGILFMGTWVFVLVIYRISSFSALIASAIAPIIVGFTVDLKYGLFTIALTTGIYIRHIDNIKRIIAGTEPKIGQSKK